MKAIPPASSRTRAAAATWLASLAPLVSPLFPAQTAEALRDYMPLLEDVAAEAFNRETLEQAACCAGAANGMPRYAELRAVLAAWCREHRPVRRALPRPEGVVPESERCTPAQAAAILRRHGFAPSHPPSPQPAPPQHPPPPAALPPDALPAATPLADAPLADAPLAAAPLADAPLAAAPLADAPLAAAPLAAALPAAAPSPASRPGCLTPAQLAEAWRRAGLCRPGREARP